jgi:predicted nucleotidyltransferase
MKDWLSLRLESVRTDVLGAYLYGFALRPSSTPRDVDVVIVTKSGPACPSWERVRVFRNYLTEEFVGIFSLPLSVMIVTQSEWSEIDGVVVREKVALVAFRSS